MTGTERLMVEIRMKYPDMIADVPCGLIVRG